MSKLGSYRTADLLLEDNILGYEFMGTLKEWERRMSLITIYQQELWHDLEEQFPLPKYENATRPIGCVLINYPGFDSVEGIVFWSNGETSKKVFWIGIDAREQGYPLFCRDSLYEWLFDICCEKQLDAENNR